MFHIAQSDIYSQSSSARAVPDVSWNAKVIRSCQLPKTPPTSYSNLLGTAGNTIGPWRCWPPPFSQALRPQTSRSDNSVVCRRAAWQFEGSRRSYVVASWGVCQQSKWFATTSWADTPFEATVQSAVKALIARGYTGGQVMTK
jgi:hypothetical protein